MTYFDYSPVDTLPGMVQEYLKGILAEAFVRPEIITAIEVDWHGRIQVKSQNWGEYWNIEGNIPAKDVFSHFEKARITYFDSNFKSDHIKEYCYQYFVLLSKWLSHRNEPYVNKLLGKLLSLENFAIYWYGGKSGIAAGTTSHRSPAYLLTRIGKQSFNEDPKYLPLIMLGRPDGNKLFYHYRQYRISNDPDFSIFVYPAASLDDRGEAFTLIESFAGGFSHKSDPRSKQRAKLLAESAILPFLKFLLAKNNNQKRDINMVDLGGGSGIMLRHIWGHILSKNRTARENWYLNCSIVGLRVQNPARHFTKGAIRGNMAYIDYQQMDYIDWINKQSEMRQFDIVLMCRLLNNLSIFDIESSDDEGMLWYISGQQVPPEIVINKKYNPVYCLSPEEYHPENLIHTNGKTRLSGNHFAYRAFSLTDYYKAMAACMGMDVTEDMYFYPTRKFNDICLVNSESKSIIERLSRISKLTVIEDVDLTAHCLAKHIRDHKLSCVASAINIDSKYSSQVLAVCDRKYGDILPGVKIC
jgi:hypothetical protein